MNIFPAIDLIGGNAVRLYKGDYNQKTVYSSSPVDVARDFYKRGAEYLHLVDLDGAKSGGNDNFDAIAEICKRTELSVELGGGIRSIEVIRKYLSVGVDRLIIGTAAVTDREFLKQSIALFGDKIAVGVDVRDYKLAIKGWLEDTELDCFDFCRELQELGVELVICTDISKDGALQGTNRELYSKLNSSFSMSFTASGGVSSLEDVRALADMQLYGAILGKALYTNDIDLAKAIIEAK